MSDPTGDQTLLHASCVSVGGSAVLITGRSGVGKSDLALRLIDRGAALVADDCTLVRREGDGLIARAPDTIAGKIEVRGIGILRFAHRTDMPVRLMVSLDAPADRMPDRDVTREVLGVAVPIIRIAAYEASAPIKVELALRYGAGEQEG
ncbi:MAG: HPr kinase/phosphorylase [Sphingomonas bacterium]|nr:aldolase [Sphingomonas bacterium]MDB5689696.1 HPr kinase/phosphorylase [Sphingomonas bacterium]